MTGRRGDSAAVLFGGRCGQGYNLAHVKVRGGKQAAKMKEQVIVWGEKVEIEVYQKSKSVWIASGTYKGKPYEVKWATPGAAVKGWRETARYHSN